MARPQYPIRRLLKPIISWFGRLGRPNAPSSSFKSCATRGTSFSTSTTCNSLHQELKTNQEFWEMFFTPYIWAGIRWRDVSRLWTGAGPTYNENGDQTSNAQIIANDIDGNDVDSPQLQACRWLFDHRIDKGSITQLLKEITYAKLLLKKSVHEILWIREEQPDYGIKVSIAGFQHVDPTLFEFNPHGEAPGLYIQRVDGYGNKAVTYERVDERRFLIVTNQELFADKNGISELEPLRKSEPRREDAEKSWGRGAQRHGHGHIIGKYSSQLLGASASTDRDDFQEMLEDMGTDTVSMTYEGNTIEQLDVDVKADVFSDFINELKAQISLVLTGSTSTFTDSEGGTKARLEVSEVAQESELEQQDCAEISAAITEQVLRRFCDYNWVDTDVYPKMQIITEEVLAPTMPEAQDTQTEILENEEPEEKEEIVKESKPFATPWSDPEANVIGDIEYAIKLREKEKKQQAIYDSWTEGNHSSDYLKWDATTQKLQVIEEEEEPPPKHDYNCHIRVKSPQDRKNDEIIQAQFVSSPDESYVIDCKSRKWTFADHAIDRPENIVVKLQDSEKQEPTPPVAIPATYKDFPSEEPLDDNYKAIIGEATAYLEQMPAKGHRSIGEGEAATTFTVKRLRDFDGVDELMQELKYAIVSTLEAENEMAAWVDYWRSAVEIFKDYGFENPSPQLRNDLKISFRQARQNALNEGFYQAAVADSSVKALQLVPDPNVVHRHLDEIAWDNLVIPIDHPELQLGGRLRIPLNFGCMHRYKKVYNVELITPESEWPSEFPGRTYRYYAAPGLQEGE